MSMLSTPLVADAIARLMNGAKPRLKPELLFEEIPDDSAAVTVPTRHGDVAARLYRPATGLAAGSAGEAPGYWRGPRFTGFRPLPCSCRRGT